MKTIIFVYKNGEQEAYQSTNTKKVLSTYFSVPKGMKKITLKSLGVIRTITK